MAKNTDGMRYPSIDRLLEVVDSKYTLVLASAQRAKNIGDEPVLTDVKCVKEVGQALEEILEGEVKIGNTKEEIEDQMEDYITEINVREEEK